MQLTFAVPRQTTSIFVVAIDRVPSGLGSVVPWRMCRPHRRCAAEWLGSDRLRLSRRRAKDSPWRQVHAMLGAAGEEGPERDRVRRAAHHIVVTATAAPADQVDVAPTARAAARALATECDGVVVDPLTGAVVFHCTDCAGERPDFTVTDDWIGWRPGPQGTVAGRGLRRFGMPEIVMAAAACGHTLCTVTGARLVADRLLTAHLAFLRDHPLAPTRTIDDSLRIDGMEFTLRWQPGHPTPAPTLTVHPLGPPADTACAKVPTPTRPLPTPARISHLPAALCPTPQTTQEAA
ncbi:hypothetical protein HNP84_007819 [Thermocatellispora tengchongensis]|uniref:Uncharacterized protein n=1 Tax=Thermocatellispora tengchongensis TaxID=1073253 RepID=A0A840PGW1_9ACTN|nr:hypothetical protein [Thermocatellispora tengchongensis]MBB5138066.1 hypothetical protein [Thermocatellispora tengchongensis]